MTTDKLLDAVDALTSCEISLDGLRTLLEDANTDPSPEMGAGVWAVTDLLATNGERVTRSIALIESVLKAERRGAAPAARAEGGEAA